RLTGIFPGQQAEGLVDVVHRIDVEKALFGRVHHRLVQHQVGHVDPGDDDALLAGQAAGLAQAEEAFDLDVDSADRLHFAELVDRAGNGEALLQRCPGQCRDQRTDFAERGTVAVDVTV